MDNDMNMITRCWNERAVGFDAEHSEENISLWMNILKKLIGKTENTLLLDIGTGTGFLAQMACCLGCRVTGVDIAKDMLLLARQKAVSKGLAIAYTLFDGRTLPYADESFECITNSRLLWTLLEPQDTFREWRRVLRPGGKVLSFMRLPKELSGDDVWCYETEFEKKLPLKYASKQKIADVFKQAGFSKTEIFDLPPEMSSADLNPWYCIKSVK